MECRKIIAEAFSEAKTVQRQIQNNDRPKYRNAPRSLLHKRIAELEAKVIALKEELENVRAQQMDELDAFLITPRDLHQMIGRRSRNAAQTDELTRKREARTEAAKPTLDDDSE